MGFPRQAQNAGPPRVQNVAKSSHPGRLSTCPPWRFGSSPEADPLGVHNQDPSPASVRCWRKTMLQWPQRWSSQSSGAMPARLAQTFRHGFSKSVYRNGIINLSFIKFSVWDGRICIRTAMDCSRMNKQYGSNGASENSQNNETCAMSAMLAHQCLWVSSVFPNFPREGNQLYFTRKTHVVSCLQRHFVILCPRFSFMMISVVRIVWEVKKLIRVLSTQGCTAGNSKRSRVNLGARLGYLLVAGKDQNLGLFFKLGTRAQPIISWCFQTIKVPSSGWSFLTT